jgi:hypothetical protein
MWTVATAIIGVVFTTASSTAFFHSSNVHVQHQPILGRPSLLSPTSLQYRWDESFSELDKLKAKRLLIRRDRHDQKSDEELEDVEDASIMVVAGELEYLYDETEEERYSNDLYHIILMPSTFHNKNKEQSNMLTIENVAETCTEILGIEANKAYDISLFVKHEGFSTLGTWTHTECLSIGKELLSRELDCRIVPFNGGSSNESYSFAIAAASTATVIVNDNDDESYYNNMLYDNDHSSMDIASIAANAELTNRIHSQTALKTLYCGTDTQWAALYKSMI